MGDITEEFEKHPKKIGGWVVLKQSMEQFTKDNIFVDKHREEWLKLYPDKWVAVFKEELIGVDSNLDKLQKLVAEKNIPRPFSKVIAFLSTKRIPTILIRQAAHTNAPH